MSELSLEQIQEKTIRKLLTISKDSDKGAIVFFKEGDVVSASIINLTKLELASILNSLQNEKEVE